MTTKENNKSFLKIIRDQRNKKKREKFEGTFLEYLEIIKQDPDVAKHAHKRLYATIIDHGIVNMKKSNPRCRALFDGETIKTYKYFEKDFFGMENVLAKVMRFLKSASLRGEESRQVLLLMGPVGAGKSALAEKIKKSLEGQIYYHLMGDPQRGEPLQLIPRGLREKFEKILTVKIEGDLSPSC